MLKKAIKNRKSVPIFGITLVLLFTWIALATSTAISASSDSDVEIYAFDQNPAGSDEGNEWLRLFNPSSEFLDIGKWILENGDGEKETIAEGTTIYPFAWYDHPPPPYQWLDNEDEFIILKDSKGKEVDRTPVLSDTRDDNSYWVLEDSKWVFEMEEEFGKPTPIHLYTPKPLNTSKFGESGIVIEVMDGNTIEVEGIGRIRLADVNAPEIDTEKGKEAKEYVNELCFGKKVYLDIDDFYILVAVVYIPYNETHFVNLNQLLLKEEYAEAINYPNEFNPDIWLRAPLEYIALMPTPSPLPTLTPTPIPTPGFEFESLFAIIGILAAISIYLIRRK